MPLSVLRFSSSLNAMAANAGRFSAPSGSRMSLAERVDQLGQSLGARLDDLAGDDVAVDDDAAAFANVADTVDLPAPIPPVNPIAACTVCQRPDAQRPGSSEPGRSRRTG